MPRQTNGCRAKIRHVGLAFRALEVRPLFLFCLPRGGSTLVQRVIAAHPKVSTLPEPWLLLPLVYATREQGARAEYWHEATAQSVKDFSERLPAGTVKIPDRQTQAKATSTTTPAAASKQGSNISQTDLPVRSK